ncbi:uncharacterized protein [Anas acuta]|uniref:uncharacterized protein n=1 Tax=Anas acuta TaxID=28680 RepID=UPI0035C8EFD6
MPHLNTWDSDLFSDVIWCLAKTMAKLERNSLGTEPWTWCCVTNSPRHSSADGMCLGLYCFLIVLGNKTSILCCVTNSPRHSSADGMCLGLYCFLIVLGNKTSILKKCDSSSTVLHNFCFPSYILMPHLNTWDSDLFSDVIWCLAKTMAKLERNSLGTEPWTWCCVTNSPRHSSADGMCLGLYCFLIVLGNKTSILVLLPKALDKQHDWEAESG